MNTLIHNVMSQTAPGEATPYHVRAIDWEKVSWDKYKSMECEKKWEELLTKVHFPLNKHDAEFVFLQQACVSFNPDVYLVWPRKNISVFPMSLKKLGLVGYCTFFSCKSFSEYK